MPNWKIIVAVPGRPDVSLLVPGGKAPNAVSKALKVAGQSGDELDAATVSFERVVDGVVELPSENSDEDEYEVEDEDA